MRLFVLAAAIIAAVATWSDKASAVIIYEFRPGDFTIFSSVGGRAVFTDEAFYSGHTSVFVDDGTTDMLNGLINFSLDLSGPIANFSFDLASANPGPTRALFGEFNHGATLTGEFHIGGGSTEQVGEDLNDFGFGTDAGGLCFATTSESPCRVIGGTWVRVPEPATLALLGAGVIGLGLFRRRTA